MGKKKEGNEQQKRQAAREARRAGHSASEVGRTSGASKQRHHLRVHDDHIEHAWAVANYRIAARLIDLEG